MVFAGIFIFLLGLVVGSFLNAVIYRLEVGDSAFRGRSYCPHCKHALQWHDLVPLVSFVLLQGKCGYCKKNISWQYPLVELATALIFLAIFNFEFLNPLYLFVVASLLIVLFVYDLRHYILPDKILLSAIGVTVGYQIIVWVFGHWDLIRNLKLEISNFAPLVNPLLAGIAAALFFFAIFALSRGRAMGFGDVKLAAFMGLFLGWPNIAAALFAAFMLGGAVGIVLLALKKKGMKSEIPFGPFLITGTFIALLWGKVLVDFYLDLVLI